MPIVNDTNAWVEIPGYDLQSREQFCSVTGSNRKGDRVFRGPVIEFEGFFDISETSARQLAGLIGFVPSDEADNLRQDLAEAEDELDRARSWGEMLRKRVEQLTLQNAELLTAMSRVEVGASPDPAEGEEAAAEEGDDDYDYVWDDPEFVPLDADDLDDEPAFDIEAYLGKPD